MKRIVLICSLVGALAVTPLAAAHVTLSPGEWEAGGFARFDIRVPNERDNAGTVELTVQFPESVISARFQPMPGWERTIAMATLDEPIVEEGEEPITERLASVTWSGGTIEPGEFEEFGLSFQVPDTPGEELVFPAIQTYSNGEIVRWIGPADADTPAPVVAVTAPAEEEAAAAPVAEEEAAPAASGSEEDEDSGLATVALILGIAGLAAGLAALAFIFMRPPRRA
ncbi:MAG: YcnI family protein [Gaiellaceae bacterium]